MDTENNQNESTTHVLTEEERQKFEGMTIDESGESINEDDVSSFDEKKQSYGYQQNGNFKVYHLNTGSFLTKFFIGIFILIVLTSIIIFGGIYLLGFAAFAIIGLIISIILGLFN